jgi:hypothetical protein
MAMQQDTQDIAIIPARACGRLLEAGVKDQEKFYLAWDQQARRLFVVQWDRVRWVCSCGRNGCAHRLATNTYLFELSQKREA